MTYSFKLDDNWNIILLKSWSARFLIADAIVSISVAVNIGDSTAIISSIFALCGLISRIIVQPVMREEMKNATECVNNLKE